MSTDQPTPAPKAPIPIPSTPPGIPEQHYSVMARWGGLFRSIELALPIGLLALAFLVAAYAVRNSDFWQHLATGKMLLGGQYSFGVDPFSSNAADRYWVNHAWLFDVFAYLIYNASGGAALVITKGVIVAIVIGILIFQRPTKQPIWVWTAFGTLALLALAPRLFMQPTILSLLWFALLTMSLFRFPARDGSWRLPVIVGVLCAIWANSDQWFFLGPLAVVLFALGEVIQQKFSGTPKTADTPSLKMLGIATGVAILAPLLNPHHVNVWTLPAELVSSQFAADVEGERIFRNLFQTPMDTSFSSTTSTGNPINPWSYYFLLILSSVGLGLSYATARWSHLLLWVGFTLLSLMHARAIPFFAIVAAPLAAWSWCQLGAAFAARSTRIKQLAPGLGALACVVSGGLGVFLILLSWPGWLNTSATLPSNARRVAFVVEPEESMERFGKKIAEWRRDGLLPPEVRGLHLHPDVGNYLSWYCPEEKTLFDGRFTFHAPDAANFAQLRQVFRDRSKAGDEGTRKAVRRAMRDNQLRYLVIYTNPTTKADGEENNNLTRGILLDPEWSIWYMDGRTLMLGWTDPDRAPNELDRKLASLKFDPVKLAFGSEVEPVPAPSEVLPPADRGFMRRYLFAPPVVALDVEEALMLNFYQEVRSQIFLADAQRDAYLRAFLTGPAINIASRPPPPPAELVAIPVLAVRAARRAIAVSPDDPTAYYALAQAYGRMPSLPGVQQLQMMTAYTRCLERSPRPEQATPQISFLPFEVTRRLTDIHLQMNHFDLALKSLETAIGYLEKAPPMTMEPREAVEQLKFFKEQMRWRGLPPEEFVMKLSNDYENLASRQGSVQARVELAKSRGLWAEAIDVYQKAITDGRLAEEFGPAQTFAAADLINLELEAGRIEQAMKDLRDLLEKDGVVSVDNVSPDPQVRSMFRDRWIIGLWLSGDYALAAQETDIVIRTSTLNQSPETIRKLMMQSLSGLTAHFPTGELLMLESLGTLLRMLQIDGEQHLRRGLISLEMGDNRAARLHFEASLAPHGIKVSYPGQEYANLYLKVLPK